MDPTWIVRLDAAGDGPRLAVKDCIDVEGLPTTAGCQVVAEQAIPAARDAAVVAAARRAGARIVGKTNLTELCWSASGVNPWSGTPVNPADPRRLPGGSSSGSAVAVAAGEADAAAVELGMGLIEPGFAEVNLTTPALATGYLPLRYSPGVGKNVLEDMAISMRSRFGCGAGVKSDFSHSGAASIESL